MDAVPLSVPLCICIEPTNLCNFKCLMCWQSTKEYQEHGGPFSLMSMDIFHKLIEDIKSFTTKYRKKIKLIKFYSTGEPLLHPNLAEMIQVVRTSDICDKIEVTSNASKLTKRLAEQLVDAGLDYFRASIYAVRDAEHKRVTQTNITVKEIADSIAYMRKYRDKKGLKHPFITAKIMDKHSEENDEFQALYQDIADETIIDTPFILPKLEENALERLYGSAEKGQEAQESYLKQAMYKKRKVCRYAFTHMTVRNNGDVVVCCTDWPRDTKVGNILAHSLEEIWYSKSLYDFRCMMLRTKGEYHPLCKTCEIPLKDSFEDDLDGFPIEKLTYTNDFRVNRSLELRHVGIYVKNIEQEVNFYQKVFHMYPVVENVFQKDILTSDLINSEATFKITKLITEKGKATGYGDMIELIQVLPAIQSENRSDFGMHIGSVHVALGVINIEKLVADVLSLGGKMITNINIMPNGNKCCFCTDPEGNYLELIENKA